MVDSKLLATIPEIRWLFCQNQFPGHRPYFWSPRNANSSWRTKDFINPTAPYMVNPFSAGGALSERSTRTIDGPLYKSQASME